MIALIAAAILTAAAPPTQPPNAPAAPKAAPAPRSAISLDCSKQADAKGLHGKARKTFRSSCKSGGKA